MSIPNSPVGSSLLVSMIFICLAAFEDDAIVCIRVGHSADCCRGKLTTFLPGEVIMPTVEVTDRIAGDISVGSSLVSDVFPVAAYLNLCQPVLPNTVSVTQRFIAAGHTSHGKEVTGSVIGVTVVVTASVYSSGGSS